MATLQEYLGALGWSPYGNSYGGNDVIPAVVSIVESNDASLYIPKHWIWTFADGSDPIGIFYPFTLPEEYVSSPKLIVEWYSGDSDPGSETISLNGRVAAVAETEDLVSGKTSDALNEVLGDVPATAFVLEKSTILLTNADSMEKGDAVCFILTRDPADGGDTHPHSIHIRGVMFEFDDTA